jgi:hypothetical protein
MAISFVGAGAVQTVSGTSDTCPTPAGNIGDMVLFIAVHDDFSDGGVDNFVPSNPPIALTQILPTTTQYAGDFRGRVWWGIEDQADARDFTFGTLSATEEIKTVCLRFRGQAAVPILTGTPTMQGGAAFPSLTATKAGQWFISMLLSDTALIARTPPAGWTERVDSMAANYSIYVATKPVTTEELAITSINPTHAGTTGVGYGFGFVLDDDAITAYTVAGVTKDKDGDALGSCIVVLFKDSGTNAWKQIATQTSNAGTGAYSFTVYDNAAKYMVVSYKSGSPNVMDVTDYVLTPAAV